MSGSNPIPNRRGVYRRGSLWRYHHLFDGHVSVAMVAFPSVARSQEETTTVIANGAAIVLIVLAFMAGALGGAIVGAVSMMGSKGKRKRRR